MKGVILAAGLGTRLRPLTYVMPKPLLPLGEKTILERIIEWFKSHGIEDIIVLTYYLSRLIESYLGDGRWMGVKISYVRFPPQGTAGQLYPLKEVVKERIAVINGDTITNLDLKDMANYHVNRNATMTIAVKRMKTPIRYGVIEVNSDGRVIEWREKPEVEYLANIGVYILEPRALKYIPENRPCPMNILVEKLLKAGEKVYAYISDADYYDIGTYDEYVKLNDLYSRRFKNI